MYKSCGKETGHRFETWKTREENIGGRGRLTGATINYYRNAIVENIPNVAAMKKFIFATLSHYMFTDKQPLHGKCPEGKNSWCFYNKSIANNIQPDTRDKMSVKLSESVVAKIMPLYQRLACDELLTRYVKGGTQNQNESLHALIWKKCPKKMFVSKKRISIAVSNAVAEFIMGCSARVELKSQLKKSSIPHLSAAIVNKCDNRRKCESARSSCEKKKMVRRKIKLSKMKNEAARQKKEGKTYGSGQF